MDPALINDTQRLAAIAYVLANHGTIPRSGEITGQGAAGLIHQVAAAVADQICIADGNFSNAYRFAFAAAH